MIKIYTDGSCLKNPGNGGWAAIIFINNEKIVISGNKKNTTNNQMELLAAIEALKKIPERQKIQIYTDSKYVKQGITEWIEKWMQNNWKTSSKQKVKNVDIVAINELGSLESSYHLLKFDSNHGRLPKNITKNLLLSKTDKLKSLF